MFYFHLHFKVCIVLNWSVWKSNALKVYEESLAGKNSILSASMSYGFLVYKLTEVDPGKSWQQNRWVKTRNKQESPSAGNRKRHTACSVTIPGARVPQSWMGGTQVSGGGGTKVLGGGNPVPGKGYPSLRQRGWVPPGRTCDRTMVPPRTGPVTGKTLPSLILRMRAVTSIVSKLLNCDRTLQCWQMWNHLVHCIGAFHEYVGYKTNCNVYCQQRHLVTSFCYRPIPKD